MLGDNTGVTGVRIKAADGSTKDKELRGVFIAIGHKPNTHMFAGQMDMENGYIVTRMGNNGFATATRCQVSLPLVMCRITTTVRPLPPPAPVVWPPLDAERFLDSLAQGLDVALKAWTPNQ